MGKKRPLDPLTEAQVAIIARGLNEDYPLDESIADIDTIADLAELKIRERMRRKHNEEHQD